ncbi:hypothetical protein ACFL6C_13155 [Myxococcota bacterium]
MSVSRAVCLILVVGGCGEAKKEETIPDAGGLARLCIDSWAAEPGDLLIYEEQDLQFLEGVVHAPGDVFFGEVWDDPGEPHGDGQEKPLVFPSLKSVGGNVCLFGTGASKIVFSALEQISGLRISYNNSATEIRFDVLRDVEEDLRIIVAIDRAQIELPVLSAVGGKISLQSHYTSDVVEDMFVHSYVFPSLESAGEIWTWPVPGFLAPRLVSVDGGVRVDTSDLDLTSLERAGSATFYRMDNVVTDLPSLNSVDGWLTFRWLPHLQEISLPQLQSVSGHLALSDNPVLETIGDLTALQQLGSIRVRMRGHGHRGAFCAASRAYQTQRRPLRPRPMRGRDLRDGL